MGSPPHTRRTAIPQKRDYRRVKDHPRIYGEQCQDKSAEYGFVKGHPRIHGEQYGVDVLATCAMGSHPHTRGIAKGIDHLGANIRITPAYTGNRGIKIALYELEQDHPRIHGEQKLMRFAPLIIIGSPPHTRGTAQHQKYDLAPAEDHPRIHGEQN